MLPPFEFTYPEEFDGAVVAGAYVKLD